MTKIRRLTAYRFESGRRHQDNLKPEQASHQEAPKPALARRLAGFLSLDSWVSREITTMSEPRRALNDCRSGRCAG
ncbi:hypothetical protein PSAC2689_90224 [Paraburkholderia sacchari]